MEFLNRCSTRSDAEEIVRELTDGLHETYDIGFLFISGLDKMTTIKVVGDLRKSVPVTNLIGCSCTGIIGTFNEIENSPGCSLILGKLPGIKATPFFINQDLLEEWTTSEDMFEFFGLYPQDKPNFVMLPDPFLFDMTRFLGLFNKSYPQTPLVGGLASAATQPRENILILNDLQYSEGAVGVALTGDIHIETVVSQGCRPIGETYIVTKSEGNILYEVAGKPFYDVLVNVMDRASAKDKLLAREAVFIGIAMDEYKHSLHRGDFLIRMVIAMDEQLGAGAVADFVKPGQTIQFHVRDKETATEDLHNLLSQPRGTPGETPKGMLVFSCTGRGQGLFLEPDHDIKMIQEHLGPVPAAGFFCAGEIGPVGAHNFLHGFTSSIAIFYPTPRS